MRIFKKIDEIKLYIQSLKEEGNKISLVPTMGFLHEGHLSLIDGAKSESDIVIVSIFVNKKQFNKEEDFDNYPTNLDKDIKQLQAKSVDILFCPDLDEIYPGENFINFEIYKIADRLCGEFRGEHFKGVALIICKLFNIITPDIAIFGEKDFQQLQIIRRLVDDLNYDVKILSADIFREESGLAMSSRNSRLSNEELEKASNIYRVLNVVKNDLINKDNTNLEDLLLDVRNEMMKYCDQIEYLEICDEENLQIINNFDKNISCRIFVAAYLGKVRLIDNIKIV